MGRYRKAGDVAAQAAIAAVIVAGLALSAALAAVLIAGAWMVSS